MTTPADAPRDLLDEIEAALKAATPGPWYRQKEIIFAHGGELLALVGKGDAQEANVELLKNAPERLALLVQRTRRAEEWRASVLGKLKTFPDFSETVWGGEKGNEGWGWAFEFIGWLYRDHQRAEAEIGRLREVLLEAHWSLDECGRPCYCDFDGTHSERCLRIRAALSPALGASRPEEPR